MAMDVTVMKRLFSFCHPSSAFRLRALAAVMLAGLLCQPLCAQQDNPAAAAEKVISFGDDMLNYRATQPDDAVARLRDKIEKGETTLAYDERYGYLLSVLREFDIPLSSQMLVFTKTSLQRPSISPKSPRAIFFNDEVYVAWAPDAPLLEVSTAEPQMGGVWYKLSQKKAESPRFSRDNRCLECHVTSKTMGVPGHLIRSMIPDETGKINLLDSRRQVTQNTPFEKRWGGWYVTGTHGDQHHLGNLFGDADRERVDREPDFRSNITDLKPFFNVDAYPAPTSDIVALMVFEHQVHMHNLITLLNYESRVHLARYGHVNYLKGLTDDFVKYMLYANEPELTDPIAGNSDFAKQFAARGSKDKQGRSLREFDLKTRVFKYPCSYLIHSAAFDGLPKPTKKHVYRRLWDALNGEGDKELAGHLSPETRAAILQILKETISDLPVYWSL